MITSPRTQWKSASSLEDAPLPPSVLGYFHGLAQDDAHEMVVKIFQALSRDEGVTRAMLSRRLGKTPEQITRWLSAPGNWTLDTFTNLLVAMGHRPTFGAERLTDMRQSNQYHPAALGQSNYLSFTYGSSGPNSDGWKFQSTDTGRAPEPVGNGYPLKVAIGVTA